MSWCCANHTWQASGPSAVSGDNILGRRCLDTCVGSAAAGSRRFGCGDAERLSRGHGRDGHRDVHSQEPLRAGCRLHHAGERPRPRSNWQRFWRDRGTSGRAELRYARPRSTSWRPVTSDAEDRGSRLRHYVVPDPEAIGRRTGRGTSLGCRQRQLPFLDGSGGVLERGQHVLAVQVRIVRQAWSTERPAASWPRTAPTVIRVSRMQGSPRIRLGSTVIRSYATVTAYRPRGGCRERVGSGRTLVG